MSCFYAECEVTLILVLSYYRFDINLCNELDNGKTEYVMHLNPRFNENRVVRNSTINEKWGPEEHFGGLGGLESESDFESVILIHTDCYKVKISSCAD